MTVVPEIVLPTPLLNRGSTRVDCELLVRGGPGMDYIPVVERHVLYEPRSLFPDECSTAAAVKRI